MAPVQRQAPAPGTPEAREAQAAAKIVTAYTLPPDLYAKTKHMEKIKLAFFTLSPVYGLDISVASPALRIGSQSGRRNRAGRRVRAHFSCRC